MTTRAHALTSVAVCASATATFIALGASPSSAGGLALLLAAFAGYGGFVCWQGRARALSGPLVLAITAALLIVSVAVPPRASRDYWAYALYGRIVSEHHASPYRHDPAEYPSDPTFGQVKQVWYQSRTVYGPLFTGISAAGMAVVSSPLAIRLFFQSLAAIAVFLALIVLWRRTRDPFVVGLVGLHPVMSASVVNGAHNDALVGLAVLGGVLFVGARKEALGGVAFALGALVKIVGVLPLVAVAWWAWTRRGWRAALRVAAPGAALLLILYTIIGPADAARALTANARFTVSHSIARLLGSRVAEGGPEAADLVRAAGIAVLALTIAFVALAARAGSLPVMAGVSLLTYVLAAAYVLPWYVAWILPVLALEPRAIPFRVAMLMGALLMIVYWPAHPGAGERILRPFIRTGMPFIELALIGVVSVALWRAHPRSKSNPAARADTI